MNVYVVKTKDDGWLIGVYSSEERAQSVANANDAMYDMAPLDETLDGRDAAHAANAWKVVDA